MNILQVLQFFSPIHGGSAVVPYHLSRELIKRGHEVTIYTGDYKLSPEYVKSLPQARVIPFKTWFTFANLYVTPGIMKRTKEEIEHFDVVHLHNYRSFQNIPVYYYANKHSIPYVLQPHASTPRVIQRKLLKWLFDVAFGHKMFRDASKIIAVSKEEAEYDLQMGAVPRNVVTIYNGMDIELFTELPRYGEFKQKYNINGAMVLYLGRINKSKGIDFLIRAVSELRETRKEITLTIVGPDDGYKAELDRIIEEHNLSNQVQFIGYVNEEDKLSAYVDADLFVHTVRYMGGVGITPLEAILCSTPVIVTPETGEIIRESNGGLLVEYGDIEDLRTKILRLLDNPDEGLEMVKRGKEYIYENLTWDKVVEKYIQVYNEITS